MPFYLTFLPWGQSLICSFIEDFWYLLKCSSKLCPKLSNYYFHNCICFHFFQNNISEGKAYKKFGDMVSINKDDIIIVGSQYGDNVYMFARNKNSGLWDLIDQVDGKGDTYFGFYCSNCCF